MIVGRVFPGFVTQTFDTETGKCLGQEFVAGDRPGWEHKGKAIKEPEHCEDQSIELIQPIDWEYFDKDFPNESTEDIQRRITG